MNNNKNDANCQSTVYFARGVTLLTKEKSATDKISESVNVADYWDADIFISIFSNYNTEEKFYKNYLNNESVFG